jgi:hypothetical protein
MSVDTVAIVTTKKIPSHSLWYDAHLLYLLVSMHERSYWACHEERSCAMMFATWRRHQRACCTSNIPLQRDITAVSPEHIRCRRSVLLWGR